MEQNRREVLSLYREVLKQLTVNIPRRLEREAKIAVSLREFDNNEIGVQACIQVNNG